MEFRIDGAQKNQPSERSEERAEPVRRRWRFDASAAIARPIFLSLRRPADQQERPAA